MASPAVRHVSYIGLLSPRKSPMKNLLPVTLKADKLYLSAHRHSETKSNVRNNFLSPLDALNVLGRKEGIRKYNTPFSLQPPQDQSMRANPSNKVAKCLFSPSLQGKYFKGNYSRVKDNFPLNDRTSLIKSFNTPESNNLMQSRCDGRGSSVVLGRGSFGTVVKGTYKKKEVAVKVIPKCHKYQQLSLAREENAMKLNHPNIVHVFQVINHVDLNIGYVIMELYGHTTLELLLLQGLIPSKVKLRYLRDIASALEYCHRNNILHLDVKPKNILVNSSNDICKLCDFGSSLNITQQDAINPTQGTLKYSAPELLKGEKVSDKADVYSFGITMWQTVHQEIPYYNEPLQVVVYKVVKENYRPDKQPSVSNTSIGTIYKACWEQDTVKRPSMHDVILMLKKLNTDV